MKNNNILLVSIFVLLALPIPLSLISWIGTLISVADIGMSSYSSFTDILQLIISLLTMLVAGTYLITYLFSLKFTLKERAIRLFSFAPLLHIAVFFILYTLWERL